MTNFRLRKSWFIRKITIILITENKPLSMTLCLFKQVVPRQKRAVPRRARHVALLTEPQVVGGVDDKDDGVRAPVVPLPQRAVPRRARHIPSAERYAAACE